MFSRIHVEDIASVARGLDRAAAGRRHLQCRRRRARRARRGGGLRRQAARRGSRRRKSISWKPISRRWRGASMKGAARIGNAHQVRARRCKAALSDLSRGPAPLAERLIGRSSVHSVLAARSATSPGAPASLLGYPSTILCVRVRRQAAGGRDHAPRPRTEATLLATELSPPARRRWLRDGGDPAAATGDGRRP